MVPGTIKFNVPAPAEFYASGGATGSPMLRHSRDSRTGLMDL